MNSIDQDCHAYECNNKAVLAFVWTHRGENSMKLFHCMEHGQEAIKNVNEVSRAKVISHRLLR